MRPSSIDDLPDELRAEIGRLRTQGATIDRIVEHLRALHGAAPSRSAVGRHVKKMEKVGERIRRSREVSEALVRQLGDAPASRTAQLNIELLQSTVLDIFSKADEDMDGVDEGGQAALAGNPQGIMLLAKAIDHLTHASKTDADFVAKVEAVAADRERKAAAARVEAIAKDAGISAATMSKIKAGIFGVRATT